MRRNGRVLMALLCLGVVGGCAPSTDAVLETGKSAVALSSFQQRAFDTADVEKTLRTVISTLQDLSFVIDKADLDLGTVSATKLSGYQVRMTVTVRPRGTTQVLVRACAIHGQGHRRPEAVPGFLRRPREGDVPYRARSRLSDHQSTDPLMRKVKIFLVGATLLLAIAGCTSVPSVEPIGDEPVYLVPAYWEGQWVSGWNEPDSPDKQTITVNVVDAAGGILEVCGLKGFRGELRAMIRRHRYEGGEAQFISFVPSPNFPPDFTPSGYLWGLLDRAGSAVIILWPDDSAFESLVKKGEIAGKRVHGGDRGSELLIEGLAKDTLDQISGDGGRVFIQLPAHG